MYVMKSAFLFYNFLVCCIIVSNQFPKPLAPHILFSFILFQFAFFFTAPGHSKHQHWGKFFLWLILFFMSFPVQPLLNDIWLCSWMRPYWAETWTHQILPTSSSRMWGRVTCPMLRSIVTIPWHSSSNHIQRTGLVYLRWGSVGTALWKH